MRHLSLCFCPFACLALLSLATLPSCRAKAEDDAAAAAAPPVLRQGVEMTLALVPDFATDLDVEAQLTACLAVLQTRLEHALSGPFNVYRRGDLIVVEVPEAAEAEVHALSQRPGRLDFRLSVAHPPLMREVAAAVTALGEADAGSVRVEEDPDDGPFLRAPSRAALEAVLSGLLAAQPLPPDHLLLIEDPSPALNSSARTHLAGPAFISGDDIQDAEVEVDPITQRPQVMITFNPRGARALAEISGQHVGRKLLVVFDGQVLTAPVIRDRIDGGRAVLDFGAEDGDPMTAARRMVSMLRAGALSTPLMVLTVRPFGANGAAQ